MLIFINIKALRPVMVDGNRISPTVQNKSLQQVYYFLSKGCFLFKYDNITRDSAKNKCTDINRNEKTWQRYLSESHIIITNN